MFMNFIKTNKILNIILVIFAMFLLNGCHAGNKYSNNSSAISNIAITQFSLNGSLGLITGQNIVVLVPNGTDVTNLVATYTTTGSKITVNGNLQTSGITANNFSKSLQYNVYSTTGSLVVYTVTVTPASQSDNALIQFSLSFNPSLVNQAKNIKVFGLNSTNTQSGVVNGRNIYVTMPYGTDVKKLIATFIISGVNVKVNGVIQTSGVTVNDFTNPVSYVVTAFNGASATYVVTVTVAPADAKAITAYSLNGTPGTISGKTISVVMPYGTDLTSLIATYITSGVNITISNINQQNGVTPNNFSAPIIYTVYASDGSMVNYTVYVSVAAKTSNALTAFSLNGNIGSSTALIVGNNINVIMPFGTDITNLIASFTTNGQSISVNGINQTSTMTSNDFTNPVTYTVTDINGIISTYTINVTIASNINKAITAYSLNGVSGVINGSSINVIMPYGTDISSLVATFTTTGTSVSINNIVQTSTLTINNFNSPVQYIVTAADGSIAGYTVNVTVALNSAKAITSYSLNGYPGLIIGQNINVSVPASTDPTALIASFTTSGDNVKVGVNIQASGTTTNNFTNPVTYVVTAADGSTQNYIVTVIVASNSAKDITAYSLNGSAGVITGTNIAVTVPFGTDVTSLIATFTTTGTSVKVGAISQTSTATVNNFSSPVTYTVTAGDGSTQNYTITVTVAANSAKAITAYSLNGSVGVITGTNIAVTVPFGTNTTALIATFTTTGVNVKVGVSTQTSGATANNFSSPVTYTVTAGDSSTQNYIVTVTIAPSPAKDITAYSLNGSPGVITGTNIAVSVPFGTDVTSLIATFTTTGASVAVGATTQTNGATVNNFSGPVIYTVTAADGSTQSYIVTVTVAPNSAKAITAYSLNGNAGVITGTNIAVTVPFGTNVTSLIADFTTTGNSVTIGAITQVSTVTSNNFSGPVTYTVTAADSTTQNYIVTVTIAPSPAKDITSYSINGVSGVITGTNIAVALSGTGVTSLVATFITTGASVKVGATTQISGTTPNNFTSSVTYTVTAADSSTKNYIVTVTVTNNYAYIENGFGTIQSCVINSLAGTVSSCVSYATGISGGIGVAIFGTNLYIVNQASTAGVLKCTINSSTGAVSSCAITVSGAPFSAFTPNAIAIGTVGANTYAYVTNGANIIKCVVNTGTGALSSCVNSGAGTYTSTQGIAINSAGTIVYFSDFFNNPGIYACAVNAGTGQLSGCTATGGANSLGNRALTISGNYVFGGSGGGISSCQINGAILNACSTRVNNTLSYYGLASFAGFLYGVQSSAPFQATGCAINVGTGALTGCTGSNVAGSTLYGIAIQ